MLPVGKTPVRRIRRRTFPHRLLHNLPAVFAKMYLSPALHSSLLLWVAVLLATGCDTYNGDDVGPGEVKQTYFTFYTIPQSSVVIDLGSIMTGSFESTEVSFEQPSRKGLVSQLNTDLILYRPLADFTEGTDVVVIVQKIKGRLVGRHELSIIMVPAASLPCSLIAVEDRVTVEAKQPVVIPVMDNDMICPAGSVVLSIATQPKSGTAKVVGNDISYNPNSSFAVDQLVYRITHPDGHVSYGLTTLSAPDAGPIDDPEEAYGEVPLDANIYAIDFVDANLGFKVGPGIFKTTDGGSHWRKVFGSGETVNRSFVDVQFLNEREGFAIYSSKQYLPDGFPTGLATTKDGGETWTLTPMQSQYLYTVRFTTPTDGVIGRAGSGGESIANEILRTHDGGNTWKRALFSDNVEWFGWFELRIEFVSEQEGYAVQTDKIFQTADGGSSWETWVPYSSGMTSAFCALASNTLLIGRTDLGNLNIPTNIVRYEKDAQQVISTFPFKIWQLGFSPSKQNGYAVGLEGNGYLLSFFRSQDRGESWSKVSSRQVSFNLDNAMDIAVPDDEVVYVLYNNNVYKYEN